MSSADEMQRFVFEEARVRGVLVGLEESCRQALARHPYPPELAEVLGEMLAAVALLSSTLKFEGRLSLQAVGEGAVSLMMAECTHQHQVRAIARWKEDAVLASDFGSLMGRGRLVITIEPDQGQRYQGVVPLAAGTLAGCLESYFAHSEQLATRIHLSADRERAAGLLLQVLPGEDVGTDDEDWNRINYLADTLQPAELLGLDNETLLRRLFHQELVRCFAADKLEFRCDCSRERSRRALSSLPHEELQALLAERGEVAISCQFCNAEYRFDVVDLGAIMAGGSEVGEGSPPH